MLSFTYRFESLTMFDFSEICKFLDVMHVLIVSYEGRALIFEDGMQLCPCKQW
jgi:hypothetical protein